MRKELFVYLDFFNRINTSKFGTTILLSGIKSKVTSFKWKTKRKDHNVSYDGSFTNDTIEGCSYHLDKSENLIYDNVTYVTLKIYINGAKEPIISNTLTITALKRWYSYLEILLRITLYHYNFGIC